MEEIVIEKRTNKILVCVLEDGKIVERYLFNEVDVSTIGNIYIGTVEEILDGMQACFVDIGLPKKAFLPLKDAMPKVDVAALKKTKNLKNEVDEEERNELDIELKSESNVEQKISNIVKKGQKILVQIRKEALDDKGPRVSTHITLAGKYLVLMPETEIITISQKIENTEERQRLVNLIKSILPENFGCIVRTDATTVSHEVIIEDLEQILKKWSEIQKDYIGINNFSENCEKENFEKVKCERLIYNDNDIVQKIVRDMVKTTTKKIYINDFKIYECLKSSIQFNLIEYKENQDFMKQFGLITELERIDNRKIWLKSGAQIVIDKTEALTAIDVNSSKFTGKENLEETVFKVNQEAAIEIMKQIRLKDIGGIIIIDFIDMHKTEYKEAVLELMRKEQKKDRSKIDIKDFTKLNLVEMTRKKMYVI